MFEGIWRRNRLEVALHRLCKRWQIWSDIRLIFDGTTAARSNVVYFGVRGSKSQDNTRRGAFGCYGYYFDGQLLESRILQSRLLCVQPLFRPRTPRERTLGSLNRQGFQINTSRKAQINHFWYQLGFKTISYWLQL